MLSCVHTKINTCPSNVLALVRNAVWWNLGHVEKFCDVWEIVNSYNNETRPNNTTPGNTTTHGECSMNQALACFHEVSADKPGVCRFVIEYIFYTKLYICTSEGIERRDIIKKGREKKDEENGERQKYEKR